MKKEIEKWMAEEVAEYYQKDFTGISMVIEIGRDIRRRTKTVQGRIPKTRVARQKKCRFRSALRIPVTDFFCSLYLGHMVLGLLHDGFVWLFFIIIHRWKFP